jgi:hypothetical protein
MTKVYQMGNHLWISTSNYSFDILWPLYCQSFELRHLITSVIYFGHCIVCPLNYGFWLLIWYTLEYNGQSISNGKSEAVIQRTDNTMAKVYQRGNQKPLWYTLAIILPVLWITASDYLFDILWPLYYLSLTMQWLKDTKGVIRSRNWKDRQYIDQSISNK